jgi:hypothetical protein
MKNLGLVLVAVVVGCGGVEQACDAENFSGVWHAEFTLTAGNCSPLPDTDITLEGTHENYCSVVRVVSEDGCQLTIRTKCYDKGNPTGSTYVVYNQANATSIYGTMHLELTLFGSSCTADYDVSMTRVVE